MTHSTEQLRQMDKRYLWHPFTHMKQWMDDQPLVIVGADGFELIDSDGKRYLDGISSLWCNVHGHRVPQIDAAIRNQLDKVAHTTMLGLANEPSIVLADKLMKIVPAGLTKVFYSDCGAAAAEIAFKLAVQYWYNCGKPEKNQFIGLTEAYHGDTTGAMSIGRTTAFHKPYFPMLFNVHYAPTPFTYRPPEYMENCTPHELREYCLDEMEDILIKHAGQIAAIALEPVVQGAAGMIVQPDGYLRAVRALADEYDVLLICDEVATGFGRTGCMFAVEHEHVMPDLMSVAKGLTGGYLPLAATFATQRIFDAFLGEPWEGRTFYHGHTYTGNPLACAAAIASLDLFEQTNLLARSRQHAQKLQELLAPLTNLSHVGEIRQKGLMVGVELVADRASQRPFDPRLRVGAQVCQALRNDGIILRPLADTVVLMPPLAMPESDLERIVAALTRVLARLSVDGTFGPE